MGSCTGRAMTTVSHLRWRDWAVKWIIDLRQLYPLQKLLHGVYVLVLAPKPYVVAGRLKLLQFQWDPSRSPLA